MDIRQLGYLIALAREKHFTRAAEACHVTQPTLSGRIRQLEEELGVTIVERGQRYHGLTREGERVLKWAQRIVEDFDGLRQDLAMLTEEPEGRLTLGVIPSAMPALPTLTAGIRARYPRVSFEILSLNSRQIARGLEDFTLDAGITYLENEPLQTPSVWPLYHERYRLFIRRDQLLADRETVTWTQAAELALCALTPDMQNRRIIDAAFAAVGRAPKPMVESNSVLALCAHVATGAYAAVLPEYFLGILGAANRLRAIPLAEPSVTELVGIVALDRDPRPSLLGALIEDLGGFEARLGAEYSPAFIA